MHLSLSPESESSIKKFKTNCWQHFKMSTNALIVQLILNIIKWVTKIEL